MYIYRVNSTYCLNNYIINQFVCCHKELCYPDGPYSKYRKPCINMRHMRYSEKKTSTNRDTLDQEQ